jgi:hypothetical protein
MQLGEFVLPYGSNKFINCQMKIFLLMQNIGFPNLLILIT